MSEKEFKVGDIVRLKNNVTVTIIAMTVDGGFHVRYPNSETSYLIYKENIMELVEAYDPKTDFLTELSELLRKYDAEFSDYENYEVIFNLGDKTTIFIDTTAVFNWTIAQTLVERGKFP